MEVGVGIHGEPGRFRRPLMPADDIVTLLLEPILKDWHSRQPPGAAARQRLRRHRR
jgi:dihydroxyacetone kinase